MEQLINIDINFTLFLNGIHNEFFDFIMFYISNKFIWIPFYLFLIFLLFKKAENKKQIAIFLGSIVVAIFLADKISVHLFKNVFERLRPCHNQDITNIIHTVNNHCGGQFGFISSHASNVFALAVLFFNIFDNKNLKITLIIWATVVSYSRVYLGVHFFGDIFTGAIVGSLIGFGVSKLVKFALQKFS